jgi:hypothetical protein
VLTASTLLILCGACSAFSRDRQDSTGVSDILLHDSAQFQLASGLFRLPELTGVSRGSVLATAPYVEALGRERLALIPWQQLENLPVPADLDLPSARAYLAVRRAAGPTRLAGRDLQTVTAAVEIPPVEDDLGAEVGSLAVWSRARADLNALGGRLRVDRKLTDRLARLDAGALTGHPYLLYEAQQAYRLSGQPLPEGLGPAVAGLADLPLAAPTDVQAVLDAVAVVRTRAARGLSSALPTGYQQKATALLAGDQLEDLSRASLLEVLAATKSAAVADEVERLGSRVDPGTGLLTPTSSGAGSVDATYLFARLLDSRFAEIANDRTQALLEQVAGDSGQPLVLRLQATLALKNAGADLWHGLAPPLLDQVRATSGTVDRAQLPDYLSTMEPAVQLDPDIAKRRLRGFDPGDEVDQQKLAASAVSGSYLFANEEQVGAMFAPLQKSMTKWLTSPVPFPQLMTAASTLPSSRAVQLSSAEMEATGNLITGHQGCAGAQRFFSVDGNPTSTCSVVMTLLARSIPGVPS